MTRFLSRPSALATRALLLVAFLAPTRTVSAQELPSPSGAATANALTSITVPVEPPRDWFGQRPWAQWTSVTGDWNGARADLRDAGFDVAVTARLDTSLAPSLTPASRALVTTTFTLDTSKWLHARGGSLAAQLQTLHGTNASELLGVTQSVSNIDAGVIPAVAEVWYEQPLGSRARLKAGRVDVNSEFAFVDLAGDFLSASMGYSPSITYMPTYPTPASGAMAAVQAGAGIDVRGGIFDGTAGDGDWVRWDTRFAIAQLGKSWDGPAGETAGRVAAGAWQYQPRIKDGSETAGLFATFEQTFPLGERTAGAFVQAGTSDPHSAIQRHAGGGVTLSGMVPARGADVTAIGATWIRFAPGSEAATELVVEMFHRIALTPAFGLVPDLQWISRPAGGVISRTVVFTIRLHIEL